MHQPGRVVAVADEVGDVVDDRDIRMNHRVLAADTADRQRADDELVADMHGSPRSAELFRGLRVGVQRRLRVGVDQRGQPLGVGMVGVLVRDQDRRQAGDALEAVREVSGIEQHGFVVQLGE